MDGGSLGCNIVDAADRRQWRRQATLGVSKLVLEAALGVALGTLGSSFDLLDFVLNGLGAGLPFRLRLRGCLHQIVLLRGRQEGLQAVVVGLGNVVELVVVAAGTADGERQ